MPDDDDATLERLRQIEAEARAVVDAYTSETAGDLAVAWAIWRLKALLDRNG
jgi:hypothetical protein